MEHKKREIQHRRQLLLLHGNKLTSQPLVKPDLPAQRPIDAQPPSTAAELHLQS